MPTIEKRKCEFCNKEVVNEFFQFTQEVYAIYGDDLGVACADCYRKKVNPLIEIKDLEEL